MLARILYGVGCICFSVVTSVHAQMFATESESKPETVSPSAQQKSDWNRFYGKNSQSVSTNVKSSSIKSESSISSSASSEFFSDELLKPPAKQEVVNPEDYTYKLIPQISRPTLDGVKRGRTSVIPVTATKKEAVEGYIYVFYSDFSLGQMMNGATTCDVKFQILTTLDRKLNSVAMRLKWPNMETPLAFLDVNPNQQYHLNYTLLGDGCYSMDKIPNIVINRCRVKGMTQEDCAAHVRWIRKVKQ